MTTYQSPNGDLWKLVDVLSDYEEVEIHRIPFKNRNDRRVIKYSTLDKYYREVDEEWVIE